MFPNIRRDRSNRLRPGKQRGSMLVMAIFVLTVLSLLGMAMIQILSDGNRSIVYEVYGARAFNAANSGAERALGLLFPPGGGNGSCPAPTPFSLASQVAFHGCTIKVKCQTFDITETGFRHYRLESAASCDAGPFTTQRTVAVEARERL